MVSMDVTYEYAPELTQHLPYTGRRRWVRSVLAHELPPCSLTSIKKDVAMVWNVDKCSRDCRRKDIVSM